MSNAHAISLAFGANKKMSKQRAKVETVFEEESDTSETSERSNNNKNTIHRIEKQPTTEIQAARDVEVFLKTLREWKVFFTTSFANITKKKSICIFGLGLLYSLFL